MFYHCVLARDARIVNKPFEMEIGGPSEGPLLPLCRPARLFLLASERYIKAFARVTRAHERPRCYRRNVERGEKRSGSRIIGISFVSLGGS